MLLVRFTSPREFYRSTERKSEETLPLFCIGEIETGTSRTTTRIIRITRDAHEKERIHDNRRIKSGSLSRYRTNGYRPDEASENNKKIQSEEV